VQDQCCPATVSGTKSARTPEGRTLGKAQRVGVYREPGHLPEFLLESLSRGRVPVVSTRCLPLTCKRLGFFCPCLLSLSCSYSPGSCLFLEPRGLRNYLHGAALVVAVTAPSAVWLPRGREGRDRCCAFCSKDYVLCHVQCCRRSCRRAAV
jgi:hypothetical protein